MIIEGVKSLPVNSGVKPQHIIDAMGGPPTVHWDDDVEEYLEFHFDNHRIIFQFFEGEYSNVTLELDVPKFEPAGTTVQDIQNELSKRILWKRPKE